jgi:group II intron reverse transcriptase/maturase
MKGERAKRESDEGIVLKIARTTKPCGGKALNLNQVSKGGKRKGMSETAKNPRNKVRELQRKLWVSAKKSKTRRFHALYDRIYRIDVLREAWQRVKSKQGAGGIDRETIEMIRARGVEPFLEEIHKQLREGCYHPQAVRRVNIPKPNGKKRPLGIPTIRDRVVQMAAKIIIEPIFEADFLESSYGFRPKRNAIGALERIREAANRGYNWVLDADIKQYFDNIQHDKLIAKVSQRISDRRVIKLIRKWLGSGVMVEGKYEETTEGTPQGGVISPLLSNIYLHYLDKEWEQKYTTLGILTRYADDFIIQSKKWSQMKESRERVKEILSELGLELEPDKSQEVNLGMGKGGFNFLGHYLRKCHSIKYPGHYFLNRWPSQRSMAKVREKIRQIVNYRRMKIRRVQDIVPELNQMLRGWTNYFKSGNAARKFLQIMKYVWQSIVKFQSRRQQLKRPYKQMKYRYTYDWFQKLGIHQLVGNIRYPKLAYLKA